ncbi:MAG TPA: hypothetical protein VG245_07995, partial [Candidatus Dormibacteraeota bacterium]|nr:hypothetical protein [Candidatus Dormibacteraeota bacterium]
LWQAGHVQAGHVAYINGAVHQHGVWYYFPEALALKASLPLACLGLAGAAAALLARRREVAQWVLLPAALLVVLAGASGIEIGVRYVLPVFPLLAVAGAFCLLPWTGPAPFRRGPGPDRRWRAVARAALVAALLAAPVTALASAGGHIGYFQLVDRPERYLSDSNLDWGQDAWRLRDWWVAAGRPPLTNTYFSQLPLSAYGIDSTLVSPTSEPAGPGLYAISLTHATAFGRGADCPYVHALLAPITARVGTSIVVTHIPGLLPRQRPGPDADCL